MIDMVEESIFAKTSSHITFQNYFYTICGNIFLWRYANANLQLPSFRKFQNFSEELLSEFPKIPNLSMKFIAATSKACLCKISAFLASTQTDIAKFLTFLEHIFEKCALLIKCRRPSVRLSVRLSVPLFSSFLHLES
jgi:hypothetical protein